MSIPREQLEKWVGEIDVKADKVLDVGGSQLPIKDRVKSWEVKEYKILDLETPHECKQKPDYEGDIQVSGGILILDEEMKAKEFDVVFCLEVAEYWYNPMCAINMLKGLTKQNGLLYISFPFIYPIHNPEGMDYLRYTRWGSEKLLTEAGFVIEENTPRVNKNASIRGYYAMEGMRPCKTYDNHEETGYLIKARKR